MRSYKRKQCLVLLVEFKKILGFEELGNSISHEVSVGSPQIVSTEEDTVEKKAELKGHHDHSYLDLLGTEGSSRHHGLI